MPPLEVGASIGSGSGSSNEILPIPLNPFSRSLWNPMNCVLVLTEDNISNNISRSVLCGLSSGRLILLLKIFLFRTQPNVFQNYLLRYCF